MENSEGLVALEAVLKTYPELMNKLYTDGLSRPVQEVGGIVTDLVKAARLITAPIQYMAHLQDRLVHFIKQIDRDIPKEKQVTPSATLLLPILEKLKFQCDSDLLTTLYVELLKRACDKDRVNEAHPAFISIIPQLSPDEAIFIFHLACKGRNLGRYFLSEQKGSLHKLMNHLEVNSLDQPMSPKKGFTLRSSAVVQRLFPLEDLIEPNYVDLYASHLKSLSIIQQHASPGEVSLHLDENDKTTGKLHRKTIVFYKLTLFGELFAKACIPSDLDLKKVQRPGGRI